MSLRAVFVPRSIMVIGASHTPGSVGNDVMKNLSHGFKGKLFPVNPKGGELYGKKVWENVSDIPQQVELAIVAVPAAIVPTVLKQAGKKKIKAVIVISAGFKEAGNLELEQKIAEIAEKYHFTLIGPNCLGMINPRLSINASFAPTMPGAGSIAFLSQSGALGVAILDYAAAHEIGFSKFLSLGNQAAMDEATLLEFLADDPHTKVILLYLEQLSEIAPVLKVAQEIRRTRHPKPIIVLKSGQTSEGAQAASSHTGALAGNDSLYDALFRQAGMIRADSIADLFLLAECFVNNRLLRKDRVAVLTNAGGLGVITTDALVKEKMKLASLSESTVNQLKKFLPPAANIHNPVDILGDAPAERYEQALKIILQDEEVDAVAVLLTPQSMTEVAKTARVIVDAKKTSSKPIVVSFLGGERVNQGIDILEQGALANADFPEDIAQGLSALYSFTRWKRREHKPLVFRDFNHQMLHDILDKKSNDDGWVGAVEVLKVLEACRLPVPKWTVITSEKQFAQALHECGEELVLKIITDSSVHKSDVGGVRLGVTAKTIEKIFDEMKQSFIEKFPDHKWKGLLAMEQVEKKSQEVIVGAIKDAQLGTLVGCGMGGIYTEIFNDAAFNLAPLTPDDVDDIFERLKMKTVLLGARGKKPFDTAELKETVARVSQLVTQYPQVAELDINPLLVLAKGKGVIALDARLRVE